MEVRLEREVYENLYAIIKATEKLEKAYVRNTMSSNDYELECRRLLANFKTIAFALRETVPNIEQLVETYKLEYPAAVNRLVTSGVPPSVEHRKAIVRVLVKYGVNFIAVMDAVKLNVVEVDEVYPVLTDLLDSLTKLKILPLEYGGTAKMKEWTRKLSKMGDSAELTKEQAQQLLSDLESSYKSFMDALPEAGPDC